MELPAWGTQTIHGRDAIRRRKAVVVKASRQAVLAASLVLLPATLGVGQQLDEYTRAAECRNYYVQQFGVVQGTEANVIGQSVFSDLTRSLSISYGAKPYELLLLADPSVNAFSVGAGRVFVNLGVVPLLGETRGLWAAVLGHELSHDLLRHSYRGYILLLNEQRTQAALQQAQAQSSSATQAILLGLAEISNHLLDLKVLREQENEADRASMVIMARAGYHPDFALELNRIMTEKLGDVGKFGAFFEDHPRFATRALRELKEYDEAEAEFQRRWPDASQSPGGVPPPFAIIKSVRSSQDKPSKMLQLTAEIEAHNVDPSALIAFAAFQYHGQPIHSKDQEYSADGILVARGTLSQTGPRVFTWAATVPTSILAGGHRKLKAWLAVGVNDGIHSNVLDALSPIDVEFPK